MNDDTKLGDLGVDAPAPNPAADDEPQDADLDDDMMIVDGSASCENCAHKDVCAVWGHLREQVGEQIPARTGGEPAFDPEDLAIICDHYVEVDG